MEIQTAWMLAIVTVTICIIYTTAATLFILQRLKWHKFNIVQLEDQIHRRLERTAENHQRLHDITLKLHKEVNDMARKNRQSVAAETLH